MKASFIDLENCRGKVFSIAYKIVKNHHDAEDITQEVMIKAVCNLNSFKGDSSLETWMGTITRNQSYTNFKKKKRNKEISLETMPLSLHPTTAKNALDLLLEKESLQNIKKILKEMKKKKRVIFNLKIFAQFSYKKISKLLRIPINTVGSDFMRARLEICGKYLGGIK